MHLIESNSNFKIQRARKIAKRKEKAFFLIEGPKLFEEALRSGMLFDEVFATEEASVRNPQILHQLEQRNVSLNRIPEKLAKSISDVETPPGLIGILKVPSRTPSTISNMGLLLFSIRDPGNFGTIIRSAEAAGCEMVYYTGDCVDPFQPKVVRGSMGSIFRMPLVEISDWSSFLNQQRKQNVRVCALVSRSGQPLDRWKPVLPILLCVGSESHGLPEELRADEDVSIPMNTSVESLNAAIAASICLYWISLTCANRS